MFRKFQPFFIIAETPLHPGSGSELGIVDQPIQRERHTGFPKIEGSGLKGCIREAFENSNKRAKIGSNEVDVNKKELISLVFGPEEGDAHAGAISFIDARTLLFPLKSLKGIFGWITCPMVLNKFLEDMKISGQSIEWNLTNSANTLPEKSNLLISDKSDKVVLEEYAFGVKKEDKNTSEIAKWFSDNIFPKVNNKDPYKYWREKIEKDLVILTDEDFGEFVKTSTEVIARTVIDNKTGTAGNLWYEEYLPQDTILYSVAMASPLRCEDSQKAALKGNTSDDEAKNVIEFFRQGIPDIIQIGGNQTLGKGIVRISILNMQGG